MRRTLLGPLRVRHLGGGLWTFMPGVADAMRLYLRIPAGANCGPLRDGGITRLELEWHGGGVTVRLTGEDGAREFEAGTAIIHEPQPRLYDGLPLAAFDGRARRFWKRIFLLIRIPGGRHLVRLIARRRR